MPLPLIIVQGHNTHTAAYLICVHAEEEAPRGAWSIATPTQVEQFAPRDVQRTHGKFVWQSIAKVVTTTVELY